MTIICGPITTTISYITQNICGHLVKISDIKPISSTIDVQVDSQTIPGVGSVSVQLAPDFTTKADISLISKNVGAGSANVVFTIESAEVAPPAVPREYTVKLQLSPNKYFTAIEQGMLDISDAVASHLTYDPNIEYESTDFDKNTGIVSVNLRYIGPYTVSLGLSALGSCLADLVGIGASDDRQAAKESFDQLNKQFSAKADHMQLTNIAALQLPTLDDIKNEIKNFVELYVIPALIMVVGVFIAASILSGGLSLTTIAEAAAVIGSLFFAAYVIYDRTAANIAAQAVIKNDAAFIQATTQKDAGKAALDDAYNKSGKTTQDCMNLLVGYQKVDSTYISTLNNKLPLIDIKTATSTYNSCTGSLIDAFKVGTITCDQARAGFGPCEDALYNASDTQFNIKYDPNAPNKPPTADYTWLLLGLGAVIILSSKEQPVYIQR